MSKLFEFIKEPDSELLKLAEQGDAEAQFKVSVILAKKEDSETWFEEGVRYGAGCGVPKNFKEAEKWYRKSAEAGNPRAQVNLAKMYQRDENKHAEAVFWLRKAASIGDEKAEYILSIADTSSKKIDWDSRANDFPFGYDDRYYGHGIQVYSPCQESLEWLEKAAEQGHVEAQYELAYILYNTFYECQWTGKATPECLERNQKALAFYEKAAKQGHPRAALKLAGIEQSPEKALHWYLQVAKNGDVSAMYSLYETYIQGVGDSYNSLEAINWLEMAAKNGCAYSQFKLAKHYRFGDILPEDFNEAIKWFNKSCKNNEHYKEHFLSWIFNVDENVPNSFDKALKWYAGKAKNGDVSAMYNLYEMYIQGVGVSYNWLEAINWLEMAANYGHIISQRELAETCLEIDCDIEFFDTREEGKGWLGDTKPYDLAEKWYKRAAEQGDSKSQYELGCMKQLIDEYGKEIPNSEAEKWYWMAAEQGEFLAQYKLRELYENRYDEKYDKKFFMWFQSAAERGIVEAQLELSEMYQYGNLVARCRKKAYFWAILAASNNPDLKKARGRYPLRLSSEDYVKLRHLSLSNEEITAVQDSALKYWKSNFYKAEKEHLFQNWPMKYLRRYSNNTE